MAQSGAARAERSIAERYARAAKLMYFPAVNAVKNAAIVPHWINGTDRFWYQRQTAAGTEFVAVDAATGTKTPAFNAAGIAASLSTLTKQPVASDALPFADFDYSPDGSEIRFEVAATRYVCTLATSACRVAGTVPPPDALVSPDGKLAVLTRGGNLYVRDLASGADRVLTSDGTPDKGWGVPNVPSDFHTLARQRTGHNPTPFHTVWSPDSKRLITTFVDQSMVTPYPFIEYAPQDGSFRPIVRTVRLPLVGEEPARVQFYSIDVASGARRRIGLDGSRIETVELSPHYGEWAPDARHYRLFASTADSRAALLLEIDTHTGAVREVIREPGVFPALLHAGGYGAPNVAMLRSGTQAIWSSQRDGWPHLYLCDVATGRTIRQLTRGPWVVRELLRVDEARGLIYFVASGREGGNPYFRSVYVVGLDGRNLRRITPEAADKPIANPRTTFKFDPANAYDPVSPSGKYIVYGVSPLASPTQTILRPTNGGPATVLEQADATALFAAGYRAPEPFTAKAADGKSDLYGVIYRPSDYDPARRYPVILAEYNSPVVTIAPTNFTAAFLTPLDNSTPAAEAELGFIEIMLDPRGTPFRGAAFSDPSPGYIASMGLEDDVAAIRQLAAHDPSMDSSRVGIVGASFGAWSAIRALILHNDLFKVSVAWAPPGAFHNMYPAAELTIPSGVPTYAGGAVLRPRPGDVPANWETMNSIAQVGQMRGRLLLGGGALDENVLPNSPMQFLDAAAKAGKDVETIFLPNATHGPMPYWPYVVKRTWDFLVRNLRGETPPPDLAFPPGSFPPAR